jgi:hypothetical protein
METTYQLEDGRFLVELARRTIEIYFESGKTIEPPGDTPDKLKERAGVFVTLSTYPSHDLRGCIGYPEPVMPLVEATIRAAISASTNDPRFPPVSSAEMDKILVEVSILTPPVEIHVDDPREYPEKVEIGRHGLTVEKGFHRGLLLPQVPVEWGWDAEEFLANTCMKAGLMADCWLDGATKIHRFEGRVFQEKEPRGEVEEKVLKGC